MRCKMSQLFNKFLGWLQDYKISEIQYTQIDMQQAFNAGYQMRNLELGDMLKEISIKENQNDSKSIS